MTFYNQTDWESVKAMTKHLKENGFNVSISKANYSITRETSQYNKYMKWHLIINFENGAKASNFFKTQKETIESVMALRRPLPIGDNMALSYYQQV